MSKLFGFQIGIRPHLTRGSGLSAEVGDLRRDINESFAKLENEGGYFRTDEFTDPAAADVDGIKESIATTATIRVFSGAQLDGDVGGEEMVPPRNPTITSSQNGHVTAVNTVWAGKLRVDGKLVPHSVTLATTNGGNTTDVSTSVLSIVESITVPAMGGTAGALQFGFGARMGLSEKARARAGAVLPLREIADGSKVTNGAFANPAGSPVTVYTPNAAPNADKDYSCTYEVDPR
jgi:hypothetical protein